MLFPETNSGLVRLADTVKGGLRYCARTTKTLLDLASPYSEYLRRQRAIAAAALAGKLPYDAAEEEIKKLLSHIPTEVGARLAHLDLEQSDHARTTVLMCCFCLESYINSLAYFLFKEADLLGLIRAGRAMSADVLLDAIEQMTVREKWRTVGRLGSSEGFAAGQPPFQDFSILFKFRDDVVHDKVVEMGEDRARRYNNKLADPVFGRFHLGHALFGARTYWGMVVEVHRLLGVDMASFHRHYNLKPWSDEEERAVLEGLADRYSKSLEEDVTV